MADSRQFASEEDRVNCPFYFKIGACRNGDRCNRTHVRPPSSQTLLLPHMFPNSEDTLAIANDEDWDDETYGRAQDRVEVFYDEVFLELAQYGEIEDLIVLDNVADHMQGNVYVKYFQEDAAEKATIGLGNRFFGGVLIQAEFSPVTDFREARCRAFHETRCARGGLCNFMHIKHIPKAIKRRLVREMYDEHPDYAPGGMKRGRSNSAKRQKKEEEEKTKPKRQTTEERRAMIAEWNKEAKALQALGQAQAQGIVMPPPVVMAM